MTNSPIAIHRLKALEILLNFTAQISFDQKAIPLDDTDDAVDLLVGQVLCPEIGGNFRFLDYLPCPGWPKSIDVTKAELSPFFSRNIDTYNTWHGEIIPAAASSGGFFC